ncbi:hypothetical protein LJC60_02180 [Ruminococcaceae bacterium OttesenSCG-928-D13]|nr:hypothetical protein [Ruminococcaceae bacterium OttesenSCG-928-D13]
MVYYRGICRRAIRAKMPRQRVTELISAYLGCGAVKPDERRPSKEDSSGGRPFTEGAWCEMKLRKKVEAISAGPSLYKQNVKEKEPVPKLVLLYQKEYNL